MRLRVWLCVLLILPFALRAEESVSVDDGPDAPATPPKREPEGAKPVAPSLPLAPASFAARDKVCRLIREFSAELWQVRENALEQAIDLDDAALPQLQDAYAKSHDPEIRTRAVRAIIGIREALIRGTYNQTTMETTDGAGNRRDGDSRQSWLTIGGGKAVWQQRLGSSITSQVYTFDVSKKIVMKGKLEIPLVFEYMETVVSYSPESNGPKLEFVRLADGRLKVTFTGTDGMNQTSKVVFAPKNILEQPAKPNPKPPEEPQQPPAPHEEN
jgi:hypothetical protein